MIVTEGLVLLASFGAGLLGALLGIGGGLIVVPMLTLVLGVDIRYAVAASLVAVVATSCGAAVRGLKSGLAHFRLATVLESSTVAGAILGVFFASRIASGALFILFGVVLYFIAIASLFRSRSVPAPHNHPLVDRLGIAHNSSVTIAALPLGLGVMFVAGVFSALLGIGSGIFKVLALDGAMKLPFRVSTATSALMMGVTATASAVAYFAQGDVRLEIAAPVALGVLFGSRVGAQLLPRVPEVALKILFGLVVLGVGTQMILRGL